MKTLKVFIFGLFLFIPPIAIYFFVKWDPSFHNNEGEEVSLAMYIITVIYWTTIFFIYKYRELYIDRDWQLAQFLGDKWTPEKREEERLKLKSDLIFINEFKKEYPELFD